MTDTTTPDTTSADKAADNFSTLALRAGYDPAEHNYASSVPIYSTTSYQLKDEDRCTAIAGFEVDDDVYTRISNPTNRVLEQRLAALHGVEGAVVTSSGSAAIFNTLLNAITAGGRLLTTYRLYGDTVSQFNEVLPDYGIGIDIVEDPDDPASWEAGIKPETRALFVETISNPLTIVPDLEALAAVAHRHGILLIVDNTVATPYLLNPFDYGVDVVVYSTTKAINGHGNAIGGAVVESGKFDYANGNYPQFTRKSWFFKDRSFNSRSVLDVAPDTPFTTRLGALLVTLLGASQSPFDSYLTLVGLETLAVRLDRENDTTVKIVRYLETEKAAGRIVAVHHPSASDYPYRALADKYLHRGYGALLSFDVDSEERKKHVIDALQLFSLQANLGDSRSLVIDPFLITHPELTLEQLRIADVSRSSIRLSIGLEEPELLIADLKQALDKAFAQ